MPNNNEREGQPGRADARRNRRRLLDAAVEVVLEAGGEPTRDAIAKRAGVGIATLYRHFPDQQALLRAVVLDVLDRTIAAGEAALATTRSGADALHRYLHAAIDSGLAVVNIVYPLLESADWTDRRDAADRMLTKLVDAARDDAAITEDLTSADITFAAIRFSRPLAIGMGNARERAIAHGQLDVYLAGLRVRSSP